MMYRLFAVVIALLAGASLWWVISQKPNSASRAVAAASYHPSTTELAGADPTLDESENSSAAHARTPHRVLPGPVENKPHPVTFAAVETAPNVPEIGETGSGLTPLTVIENVRAVFRQYHLRFGANPVGDNAEITASLNGRNPRQSVFLNPDDGLRMNERGELVDNWGTPFFFHQHSRTEMEIHSAGPDRKMWSQDDLVLK
jgi:hypothetical protein